MTDVAIKGAALKPKPWKLTDASGLYLIIRPDGAKWWRFDYRFAGKRKTLSFGVYPSVKLAAARLKREAARTLLDAGQDPSRARQDAAPTSAGVTFKAVAEEWLTKRTRLLSPATLQKKRWLLDRALLPALGAVPIAAIKPRDALEAIRPLEDRGKYETAHRAKQMIGQILRYAVVTDRAARDVSADLKNALQPVKAVHYPAITDPEQIGALLRAMDGCDGYAPVCAALRLAPYVFVRPGELRKAEWTEIQFGRALWRIPASKMKMRGDDHLVPLSTQAITILNEIQAVTGDGRYVFPAARTAKRPMSNGTLNAALRRLGYASSVMTGHGFRAMARTMLDERLRVPPDVIEVQLAHVVRGPLGATYNRAKYLEERTAMMQTWANYLDSLKAATPRH